MKRAISLTLLMFAGTLFLHAQNSNLNTDYHQSNLVGDNNMKLDRLNLIDLTSVKPQPSNVFSRAVKQKMDSSILYVWDYNLNQSVPVVKDEIIYDANFQCTQIVTYNYVTSTQSALFLKVDFTYDGNGNVTNINYEAKHLIY